MMRNDRPPAQEQPDPDEDNGGLDIHGQTSS
jgi:hypothetical protein